MVKISYCLLGSIRGSHCHVEVVVVDKEAREEAGENENDAGENENDDGGRKHGGERERGDRQAVTGTRGRERDMLMVPACSTGFLGPNTSTIMPMEAIIIPWVNIILKSFCGMLISTPAINPANAALYMSFLPLIFAEKHLPP